MGFANRCSRDTFFFFFVAHCFRRLFFLEVNFLETGVSRFGIIIYGTSEFFFIGELTFVFSFEFDLSQLLIIMCCLR